MAEWDSADLLAKMKLFAKRPTVDAALSDPADYYTWLTEAQREWLTTLAVHVPEANIGAPVKLVTADGGLTYTYPNGAWPEGHVELRVSRTGVLLVPGSEFDVDADFTVEGAGIRMVNNKARTFADGPYARFAPTPGVIDGSTQPVLKPQRALILVVYRALQLMCARLDLDDTRWRKLEQDTAWGDPLRPGSVGIVPGLKAQYYGQGVTAALGGDGGRTYYRGGPDFRA